MSNLNGFAKYCHQFDVDMHWLKKRGNGQNNLDRKNVNNEYTKQIRVRHKKSKHNLHDYIIMCSFGPGITEKCTQINLILAKC